MKKFWILWSPQGSQPPRKRMENFTEACDAAIKMAKFYPGQQFFVMEGCIVYQKCEVQSVVLQYS